MRGAISKKRGSQPRWPEKAEGMGTSKRARRRKLDTAKAELEPLLGVLRRAGCPSSEYRKMESEGPAEKYRAVRSSRQGCESCKVKVLAPPIACSRAASISNAREGNDARSAWMKTPQLPCRETCSGRNDQGGKQTRRPEHNEIAAAPKRYPWKVVFAERRG